MKKLIVFVLVLTAFCNCGVADRAVKNAARESLSRMEIPAPLTKSPEQILMRKGYTVSYNKETKIPNWVAWHLTADHANGDAKRPGSAFHEDQDVPMPRANDYDYRKSGWSRGHMCPAGDNKWDAEAMYQSFLFTNICPQDERLNSGDWNQIEMSCRQWAIKYKDVYIVCGPILFHKQHETIGTDKVVVPEAFFKVVLCLNGKPKGIGFICRNEVGHHPKNFYVNTIDQVERITGMDFFPNLDDATETAVESRADINEW
jgi:endonuclease G